MGQGGFGRIAAIGLLVAAFGGASCGTSNDQGISFRALGFFLSASQGSSVVTPDDDDDDDDDGGVVIIDEESATGDPGATTALSQFCLIEIFTFLGFENGLIQGLQVERVDLSYRIPGGSLNLPSVGYPISRRLGSSSGQEAFNNPRGFFGVSVLSPAQVKFLNENRNRLPEFPFRMIVIAQGVAVADSGDVFKTQEVTYPIDFVSDDFCVEPGEQPIPGTDPGSNPQATVGPFQTPVPQPQPTVFP